MADNTLLSRILEIMPDTENSESALSQTAPGFATLKEPEIDDKTKSNVKLVLDKVLDILSSMDVDNLSQTDEVFIKNFTNSYMIEYLNKNPKILEKDTVQRYNTACHIHSSAEFNIYQLQSGELRDNERKFLNKIKEHIVGYLK